MKPAFFSFFFFLLFLNCTHYTSQEIPVNPAIILSPVEGYSETTKIKGIEKTQNGHILRIASYNVELLFKGYKLYQAPTEDEVFRLPSDQGVDCQNFQQIPNYSAIYVIEVSSNPQGLGNLCTFYTDLVSGNYVSLRVVTSLNLTQGESVSSPSNVVRVP